jgi:hypothetical protein
VLAFQTVDLSSAVRPTAPRPLRVRSASAPRNSVLKVSFELFYSLEPLRFSALRRQPREVFPSSLRMVA